tara:strand:+ start:1195 stop:1455 length:261 start_codon:yes stop_codon:yes gene_type:complete
MSDEQKKYDQRMQDHEGTPRVFDKEIKEFNREKFGEDIQKILDLFQFEGETRRQIFSLLMEDAEKHQATEKAILNDNTSELTETSE